MTGNPEMKGFKMAIENIPAENESEKALTAAWNKNDSAISEWNRVIATSTELVGYSLYGGKDNDRTLNDLIGIPFIVQTASFRKGDITPPGLDSPRDYVSCEIMIHPSHASKFSRRYVVVNDGSTGIYRTIVAALASQGRVTVPDTLPETGDANTTRYDVSFSSANGETAQFPGLDLYAPEGLRRSDYPGPDGAPAATWYFA